MDRQSIYERQLLLFKTQRAMQTSAFGNKLGGMINFPDKRMSPAFAPDLTVAVDTILGPVEAPGEADQESDPA